VDVWRTCGSMMSLHASPLLMLIHPSTSLRYHPLAPHPPLILSFIRMTRDRPLPPAYPICPWVICRSRSIVSSICWRHARRNVPITRDSESDRIVTWFGSVSVGGDWAQGTDRYNHLYPAEQLLRYLGDNLETAYRRKPLPFQADSKLQKNTSRIRFPTVAAMRALVDGFIIHGEGYEWLDSIARLNVLLTCI
jgi:hypothetical protein